MSREHHERLCARQDRMNLAVNAEIANAPFAYALANEMALASVDRLLASLDRLDALDAEIAATLAEYRA